MDFLVVGVTEDMCVRVRLWCRLKKEEETAEIPDVIAYRKSCKLHIRYEIHRRVKRQIETLWHT